MSIENAFSSHLLQDAGVASLIVSRLWPLTIPQDAAMPAMAYQVISDVPVYAHHGANGVSRARIQLTMQGSYSQLVALRYAVLSAVHSFRGSGSVDVQSSQVENTIDGYGPSSERAVRRMDIVLWYYDQNLIGSNV